MRTLPRTTTISCIKWIFQFGNYSITDTLGDSNRKRVFNGLIDVKQVFRHEELI